MTFDFLSHLSYVGMHVVNGLGRLDGGAQSQAEAVALKS